MRQEAAEALVVALDEGTSGVRAVLVDATGTPRAQAYREVLPAHPAPGLVEHDPEALWRATLAVLGAVLAQVPAERVRGLGIATQRGTALVWEAATGRAAAPALSWQDGRTAARCQALMAEGVFVSPLAAATKIEWLLDRIDPDRAGVRSGRLRCGTVDAWLAWRLTAGRVFASDASNASCSGFYDLLARGWSPAILEALHLPAPALPAIVDSSAVLAFQGLATPYMDAGARAVVGGLSRATTRAHVVRAVLEGIAWRCREVYDALRADVPHPPPATLRADGGAARNDVLLQLQADALGLPVERPAVLEAGALGAAWLAGLATGVWAGTDDLRACWRRERLFDPRLDPAEREERFAAWRRHVSAARETPS